MLFNQNRKWPTEVGIGSTVAVWLLLCRRRKSDSGLTPAVIARLVRMTDGNLRLVTRLLTQRVLGVNDTRVISVEIVKAARDSLVIGQV
jgi:hypothetical protein